MTRAVAVLVPAVHDRSGGRCEAVWHPGYRCRNPATAIHHRLPRARARKGGEHLLDLLGDADNLAHLCRPCHEAAHANPDRACAAALSGPFGSVNAVRDGITVDGEVRTRPNGDIFYVGDHPAYRHRYPGAPA